MIKKINKKMLIMKLIMLLMAIIFVIPNKSNAATNDNKKKNKEYRYIQNIDYAPKFVIDATNKNYLLITFRDTTDIKTDSIKVYKYNSITKSYNKEIQREILKENQKSGLNKKTTIKILRKNISNKSENVKIKITAQDNDKNSNSINGYLIVKPLAEEKNKKWFQYVNAPRIKFYDTVECTKESDVLKKKIKIELEDNIGIKAVKIYDLNSNTPNNIKETITERTKCWLDLSSYTVKKAPSGEDACRIRLVVQSKTGTIRDEIVYITTKKYKRIAATKIELNKKKITTTVGKQQILSITKTPSNATDMLRYSTSNKDIVAVYNSGIIIPRKEGTATITATVGNLKKQCTVTVKAVRSYENTIYRSNKFKIL